MRACKVIATFYNPCREIRTEAEYPDHNQNISLPSQYLEMINDYCQLEMTQDPGIDSLDTIIVYNGRREGVGYELTKYEEQTTPKGKFIIEYRDCNDGSFGAFNYAYQRYRSDYDWWMFSEDDIFIIGDKYYTKTLEVFEREKDCGFVALVGIEETTEDFKGHAHSGCGLTKIDVLNRAAELGGGQLAHGVGPYNKERNIFQGEVSFTSNIKDAGYRLVQYGTNSWNLNNLCFPYYELKNKCQIFL